MKDGYHALPAGKIAAVVTFLKMHQRPPARPTFGAEGLSLQRLTAENLALYREIYQVIGERWLWFSRMVLSDAELAAIIDSSDVEAYALISYGKPAGLLELDFRDPTAGELAFFGLYEEMIGKGAGRWLMEQAMERAWSRPLKRFFVHTCTYDHPGAIAFYRSSGFKPYKQEVEIIDDPRISGHIPRDMLPNIPLTA